MAFVASATAYPYDSTLIFACASVSIERFPQRCKSARVLSRNTNLGTIGVERRLFAVLFYGLGVEGDCRVPVVFLEGLISLLLELYSLFDCSHCELGWQELSAGGGRLF